MRVVALAVVFATFARAQTDGGGAAVAPPPAAGGAAATGGGGGGGGGGGAETNATSKGPHTRWLVNYPRIFHDHQVQGSLEDFKNDTTAMQQFTSTIQWHLDRTDAFTDGEVVDALEHFFWGLRGGVAMELGALDGSPSTRSMTYEYEKSFGWRRVLIDANPVYRPLLAKNSPLAFSANAAICANQTTVHFAAVEYVGGIVEFMATSFLKEYHKTIYNACTPPGNISSLQDSNFAQFPQVKPVECIPLSHVLHKAHVTHVNYFILDVEGGELEVLKSINFNHVKFDVLSIETDESNRPLGYADKVTAFLAGKGYVNATAQQGRNTWYTAKDFVPSRKPGLDAQCYNGARKSKREDDWYVNRKTPPFKPCPLAAAV